MPMIVADVEEEYRKNKGLKKEDVAALKQWMQKQPHLPEISELRLICFLQSCYYSNELAKVAIDNLYTLRTHSPEFFSNRDPNDPKTSGIFMFNATPLPIKTKKENYKVFWGSLRDTNPDKFSTSLIFKVIDMAGLLHFEQEGTSEGQVLILDCTGFTLTHLAKVNLLTVKKLLYYVQEALYIRLKGIHIVNIVPFIDKIVALIKPFMKKELFDILHIHPKIEECYKFIPQECFPREFGGKAPSLPELYDAQKQNILDNVEFFLKDEKLKVDESKRVGKTNDLDKRFGVEGTFKKLSID